MGNIQDELKIEVVHLITIFHPVEDAEVGYYLSNKGYILRKHYYYRTGVVVETRCYPKTIIDIETRGELEMSEFLNKFRTQPQDMQGFQTTHNQTKSCFNCGSMKTTKTGYCTSCGFKG